MNDIANKVMEGSRFTLEVRQDGVLLGAQSIAAHEVGLRLGTMLHETEVRLQRESRNRVELEQRVEQLCRELAEKRQKCEALSAAHAEHVRLAVVEKETLRKRIAELEAQLDAMQQSPEAFAAEAETVVGVATSDAPVGSTASIALNVRADETLEKLRQRFIEAADDVRAEREASEAALQQVVNHPKNSESSDAGTVAEAAAEVSSSRRASPAERMARSGMFRRRTPETTAARLADRMRVAVGDVVQCSSYDLQARLGCAAWLEALRALEEARDAGYLELDVHETHEPSGRLRKRTVTVRLLRLPEVDAPAPEVPVKKARTAKQAAADAKRRTGTNPTMPLQTRLERLVSRCKLVPGRAALIEESWLVDAMATNLVEKAVGWLDRMVEAKMVTYERRDPWFEVTLLPGPASEPATQPEVVESAPAAPTVEEVSEPGLAEKIEQLDLDAVLPIEQAPAARRVAPEVDDKEPAKAVESEAVVQARTARASAPEAEKRVNHHVTPAVADPSVTEPYAARWAKQLGLQRVGDTWRGHVTEICRRLKVQNNQLFGHERHLVASGWMDVTKTMAERGPNNERTMVTVTLLRVPDMAKANYDHSRQRFALASAIATLTKQRKREERNAPGPLAERLREGLDGVAMWEGKASMLMQAMHRAHSYSRGEQVWLVIERQLDELQKAQLLRWRFTGEVIQGSRVVRVAFGDAAHSAEFSGPITAEQARQANKGLLQRARQDCSPPAIDVFERVVMAVCERGVDELDADAPTVLRELGMEPELHDVVARALHELHEAGYVLWRGIWRDGAVPLWSVTPCGVRRS